MRNLEITARAAEGGKVDGAAGSFEGVADDEVEHRSGKIPGVAGVDRGEVPIPGHAVHGVRQFGHKRDLRAVVAGEIAEAPDHAPAGDVAKKRIMRQSGCAHHGAVSVHPIFDGIGDAGQTEARDAPVGNGLFLGRERLWRRKTPDIVMASEGVEMDGDLAADIHGDSGGGRRGIEVDFGGVVVGGFLGVCDVLLVASGIGNVEQVEEFFFAKIGVARGEFRTEGAGFGQIRGIVGEPPVGEMIGEFFGGRSFGFGEGLEGRSAMLEELIERRELHVAQPGCADLAAGAVGLFVVRGVVGGEDAGFAREAVLDGRAGAGAEEIFVVGDDGRGEAVQRRERGL